MSSGGAYGNLIGLRVAKESCDADEDFSVQNLDDLARPPSASLIIVCLRVVFLEETSPMRMRSHQCFPDSTGSNELLVQRLQVIMRAGGFAPFVHATAYEAALCFRVT